MSKLALFLALSLAANAAFFVTFFVRSANPPAATVEPKVAAAATVAKTESSRPASAPIAATLASGDLAQLKAAGIPDDVARNLVLGRAYAQLQARRRALAPPPASKGRYWSNPNYRFMWTKERLNEMTKAQREFDNATRELGDISPTGNPFESDLNFLPAAKREQLRRIKQDYGEMSMELNEMDGIQLASDKLKARLLIEEQDRDIAAVLSPQELDDYRLHTSTTAETVRRTYGDAIQSEDDYKKVYALQKAFEEQYPNQERGPRSPTPSPAVVARQEAERRLQEDILTVIGEENFAAAQRNTDQELRALNSLEKRLNLPAGTADQIYASRDKYALQSRQISENASLSTQDRRAQLKSLADQATVNLKAALGDEGAEAYAQQASWMNMLKNGTAFSTNPKDSPGARLNLRSTVYPVTTRNNTAPAGSTGTR